MEEKYAKAIANELKLIRQELQKLNEPKVVGPLVFNSAVSQEQDSDELLSEGELEHINHLAGERVSF